MTVPSHHQAKRLLDSLQADDQTIAQLRAYIQAQERGPTDMEALSDRQHVNIASNRAIEALSRVATLNDDIEGPIVPDSVRGSLCGRSERDYRDAAHDGGKRAWGPSLSNLLNGSRQTILENDPDDNGLSILK